MDGPNDVDPVSVVAKGYDTIAERYAEWAKGVRTQERARYAKVLVGRVSEGSTLLDLGCGDGTLTTKLLAQHFRVTGVDVSQRQIELARRNVPQARFRCADMSKLRFRANSFDAIAAFYSITHVPREQHARLLASINRWLKPGGLFVGSLSAGDLNPTVGTWLGTSMFFNGYDAEINLELVAKAGLRVVSAARETAEEEPGRFIPFLWLVAEKPTPPLPQR